MNNKRIFAHIALFTVALIYGANYIIAKGVMTGGYLQPEGFILMRILTGTILFWLIHLFIFKEKVRTKDLPLLAICGAFGIAINQLFFFKGLKLTSPINASIIMITTPILVLLFSAIISNTRVTILKGLGVIIGAIGAFVIIMSGSADSIMSMGSQGDIYIFINAASYAIYLVLVKRLMSKYHPLTIMKWVFLFGLIYVVGFGYQQLLVVQWQAFPTSIWWAIFYVLIFTTFLAYLLNVTAIKWVSPSVVSVYIYLQPVIATVFALTLTNEKLKMDQIWAALLIGIAVYMVSFRKRNIKGN